MNRLEFDLLYALADEDRLSQVLVNRHLAEAHGGRIWAGSDGEGRGSTYSLALPLA